MGRGVRILGSFCCRHVRRTTALGVLIGLMVCMIVYTMYLGVQLQPTHIHPLDQQTSFHAQGRQSQKSLPSRLSLPSSKLSMEAKVEAYLKHQQEEIMQGREAINETVPENSSFKKDAESQPGLGKTRNRFRNETVKIANEDNYRDNPELVQMFEDSLTETNDSRDLSKVEHSVNWKELGVRGMTDLKQEIINRFRSQGNSGSELNSSSRLNNDSRLNSQLNSSSRLNNDSHLKNENHLKNKSHLNSGNQLPSDSHLNSDSHLKHSGGAVNVSNQTNSHVAVNVEQLDLALGGFNSSKEENKNGGKDATSLSKSSSSSSLSSSSSSSSTSKEQKNGADSSVHKELVQCPEVPYLCHNNDSLAFFLPGITGADRCMFKTLLTEFSRALDNASIPWFMYGGTLIGSWRHHGLVPWDDDVDIAVDVTHKNHLRDVLKTLEPTFRVKERNQSWKFYSIEGARIPIWSWRWPFFDIFFYVVNDTHVMDQNLVSWPEYAFPKDWVLPLVRRPFEGLHLPAPRLTRTVLEHTYRLEDCAVGGHSHKVEKPRDRRLVRTVNCSQLMECYPFVQRDRVQGKETSCNETLVLNGEVVGWEVVVDALEC